LRRVSRSASLALEIEAYHRTIPMEDRREGIAAFNEKWPPRFRGK
jgi:enoyl-CoA hydratase